LDKFGPINIPHHLNKGEFIRAQTPEHPSDSGAVLVYLTVDGEEHGTRFVKALFNKGYISDARQMSGFDRTYLKLGRMATEKGREQLELTTTNN